MQFKSSTLKIKLLLCNDYINKNFYETRLEVKPIFSVNSKTHVAKDDLE